MRLDKSPSGGQPLPPSGQRNRGDKEKDNKITTVAAAWLAANSSKFKPNNLVTIKARLETMDDNKAVAVTMVPLKNPTVALLLNLFFGQLGVHRFYIGDIVGGIVELLTLGGFLILCIVDLFLIMGKTRNANMKAISAFL